MILYRIRQSDMVFEYAIFFKPSINLIRYSGAYINIIDIIL